MGCSKIRKCYSPSQSPRLASRCRDRSCSLRRTIVSQDGEGYLFVGFNVFKSDGGKITQTWRPGTRTDVGSGTYTNKRAVTALVSADDMPPGHYVIIPTAFHPGDCGEFSLTAWT